MLFKINIYKYAKNRKRVTQNQGLKKKVFTESTDLKLKGESHLGTNIVKALSPLALSIV